MRVKKVNRYWCDHCKRAGLSALHMRKHERSCTLNPARECRMCEIAGGEHTPIAELIALLPDAAPVRMLMTDHDDYWEAQRQFAVALKAALPALRTAAGDCPACIMAALRQAGIPVPLAEDFNFTAECKALFEARNRELAANVGGNYG